MTDFRDIYIAVGGIFTSIRPITAENWTAGTSRGVDTLTTNQAATDDIITVRSIDFKKPL